MRKRLLRWWRVATKKGHALNTLGFGALCVAAWSVHYSFGIVAIGLSLLILDWLRD